MRPVRLVPLLAAVLVAFTGAIPAQTVPTTRLVAHAGGFSLDGKPLQILSGEMHYPRIPREYWRDRFRKARAMGLNTISTYVFWNFHESSPGQFDFSGQKDIAAFIRTADEEGLHVIVRPGPYVCAEWDLGGYPAWLLADPDLVLRSTDVRFTRHAERWLMRLGRELALLLSRPDGPIIAVQVENEYGSFDKDKAYLAWQRDTLVSAGFGRALLYTADGDVQLPNGTLPDLPAVVNFGTGGAENAFKRLAAFRPDGPMMTGEYWAGWFDHWGRRHNTTNIDRQGRELAWMLERGFSINLYMFHGGTTFGFMNGANIDNNRYFSQTSSYDYDAALNESGRLTLKYYTFRDIIGRHLGRPLPAIPASPAPIAIPAFTLTGVAPVWSLIGRGTTVDRPRSMESFGQGYGYILYRTKIQSAFKGDLVIRAVRDYAQIYVNGALAGAIDRRLDEDRRAVEIPAGARLDILVENSGRVNFNKPIREERKGITQAVLIGDREVTGWTVFTLPMAEAPQPVATRQPFTAAGVYRGTFELGITGDTFLDTRTWPKGTVWINGDHLGRFWNIGPQQTLYVPGPWLRPGRNEVIVFSLSPPDRPSMAGLTSAIFANW